MDILRVALALLIVFGLLGGLYFLSSRAKRLSGIPGLRSVSISSLVSGRKPGPVPLPDQEIRLLRRLHLTANHQLHLIASNGSKILLCTHPHGCQVLPLSLVGHTEVTGRPDGAPAEEEHHAG
jgi:hypothetical protein